MLPFSSVVDVSNTSLIVRVCGKVSNILDRPSGLTRPRCRMSGKDRGKGEIYEKSPGGGIQILRLGNSGKRAERSCRSRSGAAGRTECQL